MGLFDRARKAKPEPVENYIPPEQNLPVMEKVVESEECKRLRDVLANQVVIVQNQQAILNAIELLGRKMVELSRGDEEEVPVPPTEEELREALEIAKQRKKKVVKK